MPQLVSGKAHRALQRVAASRPMAHQLRLREAHLLQVGAVGAEGCGRGAAAAHAQAGQWVGPQAALLGWRVWDVPAKLSPSA